MVGGEKRSANMAHGYSAGCGQAIQQSLTWRQFLAALVKGYELRIQPQIRCYAHPERALCSIQNAGQAVRQKRSDAHPVSTKLHPYVENPPTIQHGRLRSGKNPIASWPGCEHYTIVTCTNWARCPRKPRRPSYAVRQDAYKLDLRIRQMEFLSKHNIDTLEQLETHRQACKQKLGSC